VISLAAPRTRLHSGAPWWLLRDGLGSAAAELPGTADVVIVGAGITGALVADALSDAGLHVVVVDRRLPTTGSTAVSTALLQYDLDTELQDLIRLVGETDAVRAYQLSAAALSTLDQLTQSLPERCGFAWQTSLYLASTRGHTRRLQQEAAIRQRAGLEVEFCDKIAIADCYGLPSHGALRTSRAAVVDPVRLARALLVRAESRGSQVIPWTTAIGVTPAGEQLVVHTDRGNIRAHHLVLASGYEVPPGIEPDIVALSGTYALVTEPVANFGTLGKDVIVWESRRPYTYLRTVEDRWLIGGMDVADAGDEHRDEQLPARTRRLEKALRRLQPGTTVPTAFSWAGTFGATPDGMPIIGEVPGMKHAYFALGYGGNGITFSTIAAAIVRDRCLGRPNDDARIFRPGR
jgi:glycine/D-amino acid oxidase-like deaminating enzyme